MTAYPVISDDPEFGQVVTNGDALLFILLIIESTVHAAIIEPSD